jgi:hypothetical protein
MKKGGMQGGEEWDGNSHDKVVVATIRYESDHKGSPLLWTGPVYTLYILHPVIR